MAAAVIPSFFSATEQYKLDLVAEEIAQAIRFAHSESLRTGEHFGVTISQVTQKITVKKWDTSTNPVSTALIPYHPVSKKQFEFNADGITLASGISITNSSDIFLYDVIGRRRSLIFNSQGMPVWIMNLTDNYRLLEATISLSDGNYQRDVVIAPVTGRVTVQ